MLPLLSESFLIQGFALFDAVYIFQWTVVHCVEPCPLLSFRQAAVAGGSLGSVSARIACRCERCGGDTAAGRRWCPPKQLGGYTTKCELCARVARDQQGNFGLVIIQSFRYPVLLGEPRCLISGTPTGGRGKLLHGSQKARSRPILPYPKTSGLRSWPLWRLEPMQGLPGWKPDTRASGTSGATQRRAAVSTINRHQGV